MTYALRIVAVMLAFSAAVLAQTRTSAQNQTPSPGNRAYVGQNIFVAAGQQVHNATCLFCSVQVEGDVSGRVVVLFGSLNVSGRVRGGATVVGGNAVVDSQARIGGDTAVLGGNAVYETDESLSGSVYVLGGHMSHLSRTKDQTAPRRVSLSPAFFLLVGLVALLSVLGLIFAPAMRR